MTEEYSEEMEAVLAEIKEMEKYLVNVGEKFQSSYKSMQERLRKLKGKVMLKMIPTVNLEGKIIGYKTNEGKGFGIDSLSKAILAMGELLPEIVNDLFRYGDSPNLKEFDSIYNSLPIGFQDQLKPIHDALHKDAMDYKKRASK